MRLLLGNIEGPCMLLKILKRSENYSEKHESHKARAWFITKYYNDLLGKEVKKNLSKGTPIDWSIIK